MFILKDRGKNLNPTFRNVWFYTMAFPWGQYKLLDIFMYPRIPSYRNETKALHFDFYEDKKTHEIYESKLIYANSRVFTKF